MTFTLVARCPKSGQMGISIATYSIGVGLYCNGLRANVGATMTQAFVNQGNNTLALRLLAQGFSPARVLDELAEESPQVVAGRKQVLDQREDLLGALAEDGRGEAEQDLPADRPQDDP